MTIYRISRISGLDRKVIRKHLAKLEDANLVRIELVEDVRHCSLNENSRYVQHLIGLFNAGRLLSGGNNHLLDVGDEGITPAEHPPPLRVSVA